MFSFSKITGKGKLTVQII